MRSTNNRASRKTVITSTTTNTPISVASTLGFFHDVFGFIITNTDVAACVVDVYDGDNTGGTMTPKFTFTVPAGDTRGFMLPVEAAFKASNFNTMWSATCRTSTASIETTILYNRRPS